MSVERTTWRPDDYDASKPALSANTAVRELGRFRNGDARWRGNDR
jgi:hypothetical protein